MLCLCCLAVLVAAPAGAAEKLRVVKAVAFAWTFTPLDVGIETGIFAKHGLEIEASAAAGDAKMQQALDRRQRRHRHRQRPRHGLHGQRASRPRRWP